MLPIATSRRDLPFMAADLDVDFSSIETEFRRDVPPSTYLHSIGKTQYQQIETIDACNFDTLNPILLEELSQATTGEQQIISDDEDGCPIEEFVNIDPIPLDEISQASTGGKQIISDDEDDRPIEAFPDDDLDLNQDSAQQQQPASLQSHEISFASQLPGSNIPRITPLQNPIQNEDAGIVPFLSLQNTGDTFSESVVFPEKGYSSGDRRRFRDYQKEKWGTRYKELTEVFQKTGRASVHHADASKKGLARWIKRQRAQYKLRQEDKPSSMTDERVEALNCINFIWDSHSAAWEDRILELKAFKAEYNHCNVSSSDTTISKTLISWIKCQRRQYRLMKEGKKSNLTARRILQLEELGFQFR